MSLARLQLDMRAWLTDGSEASAARFAPEAQPGLIVYQNNYRAALMACLEESFDKTLAWIGSDRFRAAAAQHIDDRPPHSWSLDHYAAHFPHALAAQLPDEPEIAELATLELALTNSFIGADGDPLAVARLGEIDWDRAVLRWVPNAQLVTLATNAPAIWSALAAGEAPPAAAMLAEPATVLVWRQQHVACFRSLDGLEAVFAQEILSGMRFAQLCERLVAKCGADQGVATAGAWLGRWTADRALADIAV